MQAAMNVFALYYGSLLGWLARFVDLEHALDPGLKGSLELQMQGFARAVTEIGSRERRKLPYACAMRSSQSPNSAALDMNGE
jgi:hypothetical protein